MFSEMYRMRGRAYSCSGEQVETLNTRLCKVNSMTAVRFDTGLVTQFERIGHRSSVGQGVRAKVDASRCDVVWRPSGEVGVRSLELHACGIIPLSRPTRF